MRIEEIHGCKATRDFDCVLSAIDLPLALLRRHFVDPLSDQSQRFVVADGSAEAWHAGSGEISFEAINKDRFIWFPRDDIVLATSGTFASGDWRLEQTDLPGIGL